MNEGGASQLPEPGPLPSFTLGAIADERLASGGRVIAVRRPQVPLVQLRLQLPLGDVQPRDGATLRLLPKMLLAGTGSRTGSEMAAAIQRIGASLDVEADVDHLALAASAPSSRLRELLELLTDIVSAPSFRRTEVAGERERVAQEVLQEAADPILTATRALNAELFPGHPYAEPLPSIASVQRTGQGTLGRFHEERVVPDGCTLVVVGDVDPDDAVDAVRSVFGAWSPGTGATTVAPLTEPRRPRRHDGIVLVDRPGAVQSNLRVGARCIDRHDATFPALLLAMTIFGGNFTSRIVANLRERHGYTYSPRADIIERRFATSLLVRAEVATEVTARSIAELRYECARIATEPVAPEELESARRYVTGSIAMGCATQSGLADTLVSTVASDLDSSYLEHLWAELATLDVAAVSDVAANALGPIGMTTVIIGDASVTAELLGPIDVVELVGA